MQPVIVIWGPSPPRWTRTAFIALVLSVAATAQWDGSALRAQSNDRTGSRSNEAAVGLSPGELDQLIARLEAALGQIDAVIATSEKRSNELLEKSASAASVEESGRYQQLYSESMIKLDELLVLRRDFLAEMERMKKARQSIGTPK